LGNDFLGNKLTHDIMGLIKPTKASFLKGGYMMDGLCVLHEDLNDMHK
jgi:hypothetical protein